MSPGTAAWILSYQLAPIVFCGGIAKNIFGGTMVITQITESSSFPSGLLSSGGPVSLDDYFANFIPLPGATLGENVIGEYPFANQAVAANAVIANPLVVSCLMMCPVRDAGGYAASTAIMTALASAMNRHDSLGGTYNYVTPKFIYTDLVRIRMVDVSSSESRQAQNAYQIDFRKPLLTLQDAVAAQNTLMSKLSNGTQIVGQPSYSGASASVGQPSSLTGGSIPAGRSTVGTNTAPSSPPMPYLGGGSAANSVVSI